MADKKKLQIEKLIGRKLHPDEEQLFLKGHLNEQMYEDAVEGLSHAANQNVDLSKLRGDIHEKLHRKINDKKRQNNNNNRLELGKWNWVLALSVILLIVILFFALLKII